MRRLRADEPSRRPPPRPQKLPDEIAAATSAGDHSRLMAIYTDGDATVCARPELRIVGKAGASPITGERPAVRQLHVLDAALVEPHADWRSMPGG